MLGAPGVYAGLVAPAPTCRRSAPQLLLDDARGLCPLCTPQSGRSAPRPGLLSRVEKVGKDTPGTSWFLDLRHKGADPLGFPRLLP